MHLTLHQVDAAHPAARRGAAPALRGISLSLAPGEQVALIGPSGAGKTTLLQVAAAALRPSGGRVEMDGTDPWTLSVRALQRLRGRLLLAPQVPPLPPRQRVITAVLAARLPAMSFWTSLRSLFYPVDIPGAHQALERFDLAEKLFERVDHLSGGERQRVGLARALLAPASLWLVDEPLSALDPRRADEAVRTLLDEARARGATLLASLHQVDVALERFTRVIALRDGAVFFDLPSAQVTPQRLRQLYAQHEDELHAPAPALDTPAPGPAPVVMHCR
ncbi:phosphonate ABC transporter ATP-binding protein [Azohydromonas lata]|uniref:ATP-binding cassette domain-containing protein n=1 Tax=Azohydromonas lata TaxID=45677 RepID=A0ABU5IPC9_9BURK|nr:ATP-binding cassette domain-containing protein [Azohydromonas lata]MDZ5460766.1 ATP-binding cassette domain-containing protein [Azohydromonas lata]